MTHGNHLYHVRMQTMYVPTYLNTDTVVDHSFAYTNAMINYDHSFAYTNAIINYEKLRFHQHIRMKPAYFIC